MTLSPADSSHLRSLTVAQVEAYRNHGLIQPLSAFTPAEADANRRFFDRMLADFSRQGHGSYAINGYHTWCASIARIVLHPRILDAVEDLLGPDFVAWGSHYFCKIPGDGRIVDWHQDAPYWPLNPAGTVTAWVAIDDATPENASMRYIPGSHRLGVLPRRPSLPSEANVLTEAIERAADLGPIHHHGLRAGEFALHDDMLVHGSEANASTRRRCGLTIRYAPVSVRAKPGSNWNTNSFIVRGRDPSGHWADCPRPDGDTFPVRHGGHWSERPLAMGAN